MSALKTTAVVSGFAILSALAGIGISTVERDLRGASGYPTSYLTTDEATGCQYVVSFLRGTGVAITPRLDSDKMIVCNEETIP